MLLIGKKFEYIEDIDINHLEEFNTGFYRFRNVINVENHKKFFRVYAHYGVRNTVKSEVDKFLVVVGLRVFNNLGDS